MIHACIHTHTYILYVCATVHGYIHAYIHTCMHKYIHIRKYAYIHAYIHTYACMNTYTIRPPHYSIDHGQWENDVNR